LTIFHQPTDAIGNLACRLNDRGRNLLGKRLDRFSFAASFVS
jgi:hypothetical protein